MRRRRCPRASVLPLGWLVIAVVVAACESRSSTPPASINYGQDVCAECDHVISDRRFAAQYALGAGTVKKFDDPGCLFRALRRDSAAPTSVYFQDLLSDHWLSSTEAWFANPPQLATPRGFGWAAYASFGEAQDAVTSGGGGQILQYEQAKQRVAPEDGRQ